jgi:hypothetical protein
LIFLSQLFSEYPFFVVVIVSGGGGLTIWSS